MLLWIWIGWLFGATISGLFAYIEGVQNGQVLLGMALWAFLWLGTGIWLLAATIRHYRTKAPIA